MFVRVGDRFINLAQVTVAAVSLERVTVGFVGEDQGEPLESFHGAERDALLSVLDRYAALEAARLAAMESLRPDAEERD